MQISWVGMRDEARQQGRTETDGRSKDSAKAAGKSLRRRCLDLHERAMRCEEEGGMFRLRGMSRLQGKVGSFSVFPGRVNVFTSPGSPGVPKSSPSNFMPIPPALPILSIARPENVQTFESPGRSRASSVLPLLNCIESHVVSSAVILRLCSFVSGGSAGGVGS
jgi:hypothetical protein